MSSENYNEDYYERGCELGISGYSHYRWMPELTIPMAYTIIKYLRIQPQDSVLDFGCAKGYLVYALRLLHHNAYGYDISQYALDNVIEQAKHYVSNENFNSDKKYDWIIAKDVLEHIPYADIDDLLRKFRKQSRFTFCIIPLGDGQRYNIPSYEHDKTHVIREDVNWWLNKFKNAGFTIWSHTCRVPNLKENYAKWENGNLFIQVG